MFCALYVLHHSFWFKLFVSLICKLIFGIIVFALIASFHLFEINGAKYPDSANFFLFFCLNIHKNFCTNPTICIFFYFYASAKGLIRVMHHTLFRLGDCVVLPEGIEIFLCKGHQNSCPEYSFVVCRGTLVGILARAYDLDLMTVSFCHCLV